jgi:hypothetical protein
MRNALRDLLDGIALLTILASGYGLLWVAYAALHGELP